MNAKFMATLALASSLLISPALATGVSGNWICNMAGIAVGDLHIEPDGYVYTRPGISLIRVSTDETALGAYDFETTSISTNAVMRDPSNELESNLIHILNGPLRDRFSIKLGFLNETPSPAQLVFNIGPGLGLTCTPA